MRVAGGIRSANADISNDKAGEKPARREDQGFLSNVNRGRVSRPLRRGRRRSRWETGIFVLGVTAKGGRRRLCWPGDGCPGLSV